MVPHIMMPHPFSFHIRALNEVSYPSGFPVVPDMQRGFVFIKIRVYPPFIGTVYQLTSHMYISNFQERFAKEMAEAERQALLEAHRGHNGHIPSSSGLGGSAAHSGMFSIEFVWCVTVLFKSPNDQEMDITRKTQIVLFFYNDQFPHF